MQEEYFTVAEVAERLRVTPQAVYKWIKAKRIAVVYVGADRRITSSAVEAFIKDSTESRMSRDDVQSPDTQKPDYAAASLATA